MNDHIIAEDKKTKLVIRKAPEGRYYDVYLRRAGGLYHFMAIGQHCGFGGDEEDAHMIDGLRGRVKNPKAAWRWIEEQVDKHRKANAEAAT